MGILEKLDERIGEKSKTPKSPAPNTMNNAQVVGEIFEKTILGSPEFKAKVGEILWNIIKAKKSEEANDKLQGEKDKIVDKVYKELQASVQKSLKVLTEGTNEEKHIIEDMIDDNGLQGVIDMISEICQEKSEHVESSYDDKDLAKSWRHAAELLAGLELHN